MLYAAKRETDEEAGKAANEEESADPISLLQLLRKCELSRRIHPDEAGRDNESNTAERIVDMEAPDVACQQCFACVEPLPTSAMMRAPLSFHRPLVHRYSLWTRHRGP